jgi:hypothetical protein
MDLKYTIKRKGLIMADLVYKYNVGDRVAHKSNGRVARIRKRCLTDNGKYPAYKVVYDAGKQSKWSESRIRGLATAPDASVEPTAPAQLELSDVKANDFIKIKSKAEFKGEGFEFDSDGSPKVSIAWDTSGKMQKYMGKWLEVTRVNEKSITAATWSWSPDTVFKVLSGTDITKPENTLVYSVGDRIIFKPKHEAKEDAIKAGDWNTSVNLPHGWGTSDCDDIFGATATVVKEDVVPTVLINSVTRKVSTSLIAGVIKKTPTAESSTIVYQLDISTIQNPANSRVKELQDVIPVATDNLVSYTWLFIHMDGAFSFGMEEKSDLTIYDSTDQTKFLDLVKALLGTDPVEEEPKPEPEEPKPVYTKLSPKEEAIAMMPTPILLEGPVGSGKSTMLMEIAEELGLRYFASVMSDATTASEFKGYKNVVDGEYVGNEFREAYENGGLYVLEELNATSSNMPIIFNSIENGYFVFADKLVYGHKDFRLCATMNTITSAKDFGGRRPLDKSVRSRFHTIIVDTDFKSRFPKDLVWLQKEISNALDAHGHTNETDPRDLTRYIKLLEIGMDPVKAIRKSLDKEKVLSTSFIDGLIKKAKDKK